MPRLFALAAFLLTVATAPAQTSRSALSLGLALGPNLTNPGGAFDALVNVQPSRGRFVGSARLSAVDLDRVTSTGLFSSARDHTLVLSLLAGYAHPVAGHWQVVGSAGVSALRVTRHVRGICLPTSLFCIPTDGGTETSLVLAGLPLEVSVEGPVFGAFGVGARAFVNLNTAEPYSGLSLSLLFNPKRN